MANYPEWRYNHEIGWVKFTPFGAINKRNRRQPVMRFEKLNVESKNYTIMQVKKKKKKKKVLIFKNRDYLNASLSRESHSKSN